MSRFIRLVLDRFRSKDRYWRAPPRGQSKLNVDASFKHKGQSGASLAGLLRDYKGRVGVSFSEPIVSHNNNQAEMQGLERGLCIVNESWFMNVAVVETDCKNLISIIKKSEYSLIQDIAKVTSIDNLIREGGHRHRMKPFTAHEALMQFYSWRVRQLIGERGCTVEHVPRRMNSAADALCKVGYETLSLQLYDENDLRKFPEVDTLVRLDQFFNSIFIRTIRSRLSDS